MRCPAWRRDASSCVRFFNIELWWRRSQYKLRVLSLYYIGALLINLTSVSRSRLPSSFWINRYNGSSEIFLRWELWIQVKLSLGLSLRHTLLPQIRSRPRIIYIHRHELLIQICVNCCTSWILSWSEINCLFRTYVSKCRWRRDFVNIIFCRNISEHHLLLLLFQVLKRCHYHSILRLILIIAIRVYRVGLA